MTSREHVMLLNRATQVLDIGRMYCWPLPDSYLAAVEIGAAAEAALSAPPAPPAPPTSAKAVPAWIAKAADARLRQREAHAVVEDLRGAVNRDIFHAAQAVCGDYIGRLAVEFGNLAGRLAELL